MLKSWKFDCSLRTSGAIRGSAYMWQGFPWSCLRYICPTQQRDYSSPLLKTPQFSPRRSSDKEPDKWMTGRKLISSVNRWNQYTIETGSQKSGLIWLIILTVWSIIQYIQHKATFWYLFQQNSHLFNRTLGTNLRPLFSIIIWKNIYLFQSAVFSCFVSVLFPFVVLVWRPILLGLTSPHVSFVFQPFSPWEHPFMW